MRRPCAVTPRPMAASALARVAVSGLWPAPSRTFIQPEMTVSGPRSSCETVATNSSLRWSAASARSRASCSSVSNASRVLARPA